MAKSMRRFIPSNLTVDKVDCDDGGDDLVACLEIGGSSDSLLALFILEKSRLCWLNMAHIL
jgi:hypothetical protein